MSLQSFGRFRLFYAKPCVVSLSINKFRVFLATSCVAPCYWGILCSRNFLGSHCTPRDSESWKSTVSAVGLPLMIRNLTDDGGHTGKDQSNRTRWVFIYQIIIALDCHLLKIARNVNPLIACGTIRVPWITPFHTPQFALLFECTEVFLINIAWFETKNGTDVFKLETIYNTIKCRKG
jgi:hypothetical protein